MSDIVERLRLGVGHEAAEIISAERIMDEAADAIERWQAQSIAQYAEIKRLREENKRLRGWVAPDILELTDEIERLRAAIAYDNARRALEPKP